MQHRDHNIVSLVEELEKKKSEIEDKMQAVQGNLSRFRNEKESLEKRRIGFHNSIKQATKEIHNTAERKIALIRQHEASMTEKLMKRKETFEVAFSNAMTGLDEKQMEIESSLDFGKQLLERSNLSEILNVEEVLERRYQELSLEPCIGAMELNFSRVIYVPNEDSPGRVFTTNTEPLLSSADGVGLTEVMQGENCTFTVITKDSQGKKTYSKIDRVDVRIESVKTRKTVKATITDSLDGCYKVSYKPEAAGEFNIHITVSGEAIKGSPFQLKVEERGWLTVKGKKKGRSGNKQAMVT